MDEVKNENKKPNPEKTANPVSRLFFCFITPLLRLGFKKPLETSDFYQVLNEDESQLLCEKLEKAWDLQIQTSKEKNTPPRLHNAIFAVFGRKYCLLGIILIFEEFIKLLQPVFMGRLIRYFRFCSTTTVNEAHFYAFGFSMCAILLAIWHHPYFYHVQRIGMQIRVAVGGLIYKKILRVSANSLREMEVGKIVNLLSNDVARFDQTVIFLHYFWAAPLSLIGFVVLLWIEMGGSCMAGFACLIFLVPVQGFMGRKMGLYRRKVATVSDERIGVMNELLNAIRVIKMYAWEKPFSQLVDKVRLREIKLLRLQAIFQGLLIGLFFVTGKIIVLCALVAYFLVGGSISAEMVFVVSAMFNTVRLTLTLFLPFAIQFYAEYKVTTTRIEKFLVLAEHSENEHGNALQDRNANGPSKDDILSAIAETKIDNPDIGIHMMNFSAKWGDETAVLKDINLDVKPGQLVMIVGPVGAGKSSILHSLCGEAQSISGTLTINGRMVYVPQEPWIFSASVRQNILFGRQSYEVERYEKALTVSQLNQDISGFPHGDATVVGDKGAALSGGQKARINLARAIYYDADIYLLDDPLSAVDASVGRLLFEKCVMEHLSSKIRILVTHQLQYLKYADHIVVMKEGSIAASGTFATLESLGENFTSILRETEESYSRKSQEAPSNPGSPTLASASPPLSVKRRSLLADKLTTKNGDTPHKENEEATPTESALVTVNELHETKALLDGPKKIERQQSQWKRDVMSQFEEEKSSGLVNWRVYFAYFKHMGNCCSVFTLCVFCILVQILFNLSDYWLNVWATAEDIKRLIDEKSNQTENICPKLNETLQQAKTSSAESTWRRHMTSENYLWIYATLIGLLTLTSLIRSASFRVMLNRSSFLLHSKMFRAVLDAPMLFFDRNPIGRILNRFSKDTGTMDEQLSFVTFDFIQGIITFVGIILMIGFMNPLIFIPTLPLIFLFLYARTYYMRSARVIKRLEATTKSPVYSHVSATLNGLTSIRSFGAQEYVVQDFHRHQNTHTSVYCAFLSTGRWFSLVIDWLCSIFVTVVAFISVFTSEAQDAGTVGLTLFYAISLLGFFQWIIRQSTEMESMMVSVERVLEYTNLKPEEESKAVIQPAKDWPREGQIEFKNVSLRYSDDSDYVLKNLSLIVTPKEKIGIVGRTGAGKSSILNAIFRLSKIEGRVVIDGVDSQTVDLHELRKHISIIPQDPVLFIGTLRKNLDPFDEYEDEAIWNALDQVELKAVFKEYELGLESHVQSGGANLSVGQRQLVCLARALLKQNKILVIDEATANVDLHTDSLIQQTIRRQFKECTVLTIAHRLNTIMDSDRIMVMDKGRLVELDQPSKLIEKGGAFSGLVEETGRQNAAHLIELAAKAKN